MSVTRRPKFPTPYKKRSDHKERLKHDIPKMSHPMFPTPTARDWKGCGTVCFFTRSYNPNLDAIARFLPVPQKTDGLQLIKSLKDKVQSGKITIDDLNIIYPPRWNKNT